MTGNDSAMVSIDLIVALVLVSAAVIMAIQIMPTLSHEDRDWRIRQYMTATRATDNLVLDAGEPGWVVNWTSGNYSSVTKIGFLYVNNASEPKLKVLNVTKVISLMGDGYADNTTGTIWWEFPNPAASEAQQENASRTLGLSGYNFYIRLHPVGLEQNGFDPAPLETNLSEVSRMKGINFDTVSVTDRYVFIADPSVTDKIKYLTFLDTDNKYKAAYYRLNLWVW